MKVKAVLSVVLLVSGWIMAYGQVVKSEVPGDHFSLEGALELFKESSSPEDFERRLNSPDSKVNNLDLNGDGYVDYIRVLNRNDGNIHLFILQAVISDSENQDVAVIELEKLANGKAVLQIVGDEDIYGVTTIIEPTREVRSYAGTTTSTTVVNVWAWPAVSYVYSPYYTVWVSPWSWHMRPVWYRTWRPVAYVHYHRVWYPYRPYYTVCHTRRVVYAPRIYRPYRASSVIVHHRHHDQIAHYRTVHHDRNGRTRNDRERSYTRDERPSAPNSGRRRDDYTDNSRSSFQRETTRERNAAPYVQRNTTTRNREETNRPVTVPSTRDVTRPVRTPRPAPENGPVIRRPSMNTGSSDVRPQTSSPTEIRKRPEEQHSVQQRSVTRERTTPPTNYTPARSTNVSRSVEKTRSPAVNPAPPQRTAPSRQPDKSSSDRGSGRNRR